MGTLGDRRRKPHDSIRPNASSNRLSQNAKRRTMDPGDDAYVTIDNAYVTIVVLKDGIP